MPNIDIHVIVPADHFFDDPDGQLRSAVMRFLKERGVKGVVEIENAVCLQGEQSAAKRAATLLKSFQVPEQ